MGFRALCAANLACLMTGAVAGIFFNPSFSQIIKF
jgi:hypothetical protein